MFDVALPLSVAGAACAFDLWNGRIPNALTYAAIALGLGMGFVPGTELGPGSRFLGLGTAFVPTFALFLAGVLGGGDVKLLAALGALLGFPVIVDALIWSGLAGGVIGIAVVLLSGQGVLALASEPAAALKLRIPFGTAIFCGTLAALFGPTWGLA